MIQRPFVDRDKAAEIRAEKVSFFFLFHIFHGSSGIVHASYIILPVPRVMQILSKRKKAFTDH